MTLNVVGNSWESGGDICWLKGVLARGITKTWLSKKWAAISEVVLA